MDNGKLPWFPFYASDWLNDIKVSSLTLAEQGAYHRLLCHQWIEGSLPDDPGILARLLGFPAWETNGSEESEIIKKVVAFFPSLKGEKGQLANPRLRKIWEERQQLHKTYREAGRKGGLSQAKGKLKPPSSILDPDPDPDPDKDPDQKDPNRRSAPPSGKPRVKKSASKEKSPPKKTGHATWMTPIFRSWKRYLDADPYPGKVTALKPLIDEHGWREVCTRLEKYLQKLKTEKKLSLASLARFQETFGAYGTPKPDPETESIFAPHGGMSP